MSGPNLDSDHEIIETIKMFSGDEKEFHQLHSMIMKVSMKRKLTWFQGVSFFQNRLIIKFVILSVCHFY